MPASLPSGSWGIRAALFKRRLQVRQGKGCRGLGLLGILGFHGDGAPGAQQTTFAINFPVMRLVNHVASELGEHYIV
jgi:hypothetical protein